MSQIFARPRAGYLAQLDLLGKGVQDRERPITAGHDPTGPESGSQ